MSKVSIIIPVYNTELYLRQCLNTVLGQTLEDIQVICVNDGSTDGSLSILETYAKKDSRIEIINQSNRGAASARNAALQHIKGDFTHFVDSDDWLEPNLCEKAVAQLEKYNTDICYFGWFQHYYHDPCTCRVNVPFEQPDSPLRTFEQRRELLYRFAPWHKMYRTSFLLNNGIRFNEAYPVEEDIYQNWQSIVLAETICVLPMALYHQLNNRSGSLTELWQKIPNMRQTIIDGIVEMLRRYGKYEQYEQWLHLL